MASRKVFTAKVDFVSSDSWLHPKQPPVALADLSTGDELCKMMYYVGSTMYTLSGRKRDLAQGIVLLRMGTLTDGSV